MYMVEPVVYHCELVGCPNGELFSEAFNPQIPLIETQRHLKHGDRVYFQIQEGLTPIVNPKDARVYERYRVFLSD